MNKNGFTVGILTRNSLCQLKELVPLVREAGEILVVDDESEDGTGEWAKNHGCRVIRRALKGDFAKARNFLIKQARCDWIWFIDADERPSPGLCKEVIAATAEAAADGFYIRRQDIFLGHKLKYAEAGNTWPLRLGRKGTGWWYRPVHETWKIAKTAKLQRPLWHKAHTGRREFDRKIKVYADLEARYRVKSGYPWSLIETVSFPLMKWVFNYFIRRGFLDGRAGWWYAYYMAKHSWLAKVQHFRRLYQVRTKRPGLWVWRWGVWAVFGLAALGQAGRWQVTPVWAIYAYEAVMALMVVVGVPALMLKKLWYWPKLSLWWGLWLMGLALSLAANWARLGPSGAAAASWYWWRLALYGGFAMVVGNLYRLGWVKLAPSRILLYLGGWLVIAGWLQYGLMPDLRWLYGLGWDDHYYRLASWLLDPGFTGLIIAFWLWLIEWRGGKYLWPLWPLGMGALLLTYSRSAFAAYIAGEAIMAWRRRRLKLGLVRVGILIGALWWLPTPPSEGTQLLRTYSINARKTTVTTAAQIFKEYPWFGIGFNAYRQYTQPEANQLEQPVHPSGPDNSYLLVLATAGVVGGLGLVMMAAATGWYFRDLTLILATLTGLGVHALANNSLFYPWVMLWLTMLGVEGKLTGLKANS